MTDQESPIDEQASEKARERGNEFFKKERYKEALEAYTEAIRLNPKDVRAFGNRARCHHKLEDYEAALKDCNAGIALEPNNTKPYLIKGKVYTSMTKLEHALDSFRSALNIDENCREAISGYTEAAKGFDTVPAAAGRRARSDPFVHRAVKDPVMVETLKQLVERPAEGREHIYRDSNLARNLQKMVQGGGVIFR